jgi:hypothetical protein
VTTAEHGVGEGQTKDEQDEHYAMKDVIDRIVTATTSGDRDHAEDEAAEREELAADRPQPGARMAREQ